jgi:hypothetical protein
MMGTALTHPDELLIGAEAIARDLAGGRDPTSSEVRRVRHWLAGGVIRTRKLGQLHTLTRRDLRAQVSLDESGAK